MTEVQYKMELVATVRPEHGKGHVTFGYDERSFGPVVTVGIKEWDERTEGYRYAVIEVPLSQFLEVSSKFAALAT